MMEPQSTSGVRAALSHPRVYEQLQLALGARRALTEFTQRYVQAPAGSRVLDVGCGPGTLRPYLPDSDYVGIDLSQDYVAAAQRAFGSSATFVRGDVAELPDLPPVDIVIACGLLHHLTDDSVCRLARAAARLLGPGQRLVTVDPAWVPRQRRSARWLQSRDRGRCIRTAEGYAELLAESFARVDIEVRHDLLRVPYDHAIVIGVAGPSEP